MDISLHAVTNIINFNNYLHQMASTHHNRQNKLFFLQIYYVFEFELINDTYNKNCQIMSNVVFVGFNLQKKIMKFDIPIPLPYNSNKIEFNRKNKQLFHICLLLL